MKPRGHFLLNVVQKQSPFIQNLVAVAVDECHLIWDWERFRKRYGDIGKLRSILSQIPFVCLSATLTPNVAAYVHRVCRLNNPTMRFNISIRRDNINIIVSKVDGCGIDPLFERIPELHGLRSHEKIPKTLIFHDCIDSGIDIVNQLIARMPPMVGDIPSDIIVTSYYGSLDAKAKSKVLHNLMKGDTRIVVCTDAFGLGIDIPDIEVVIQWHVDEKLVASTLCQRIGRAARDPDKIGVVVIYVGKSLVDSIAKDWVGTIVAWEKAWITDSGTSTEHPSEDSESEYDDIRLVPVSKERDIRKFGLPVRIDTQSKVRTHLHSLYREINSLREAHRQARSQVRGTRQNPIPMAKKLDPSVLWFICTQGCRHMVLGIVFEDVNIFERSHTSWCCDWCSFHSEKDDPTNEDITAGISVAVSILNPNSPSKPKSNPSNGPGINLRPETITRRQIQVIRLRLMKLRDAIWNTLSYPDTEPCIVFTDKALESIISNIKKAVEPQDLVNMLEDAGVSPQLSLLSEANIFQMHYIIEFTIHENVPPVPILPKPRTDGFQCFECYANRQIHVDYLCRRGHKTLNVMLQCSQMKMSLRRILIRMPATKTRWCKIANAVGTPQAMHSK